MVCACNVQPSIILNKAQQQGGKTKQTSTKQNVKASKHSDWYTH